MASGYYLLLVLVSTLLMRVTANEALLHERLQDSVTTLIEGTERTPVSVGDFFLIPGNGLSRFSEAVRRTIIFNINQHGIRVIDQAEVEAAILAGRVSNYQDGLIIPHAAQYHILGSYTVSGPEVVLTLQSIRTRDHAPIVTQHVRLFRSELAGVQEYSSGTKHQHGHKNTAGLPALLASPQHDQSSLNELVVNDFLAKIPKNFTTSISTRTGRNVFYDGESLQFSISSDRDC
jgi:hypothetical protein